MNGRALALALALSLFASTGAGAWVLTITAGPKAVFLQVGNGSFTGTYQSGGTPRNNAQINVVSVEVPAARWVTEPRRR